MPTVEFFGTITTTGSEQSLGIVSANRTLQLYVDLTNMAETERTVFRSKRKILSTGALRTAQRMVFNGVQSSDGLVAIMDPISSPHEAEFTIQMTGGTARDYDFSVESL